MREPDVGSQVELVLDKEEEVVLDDEMIGQEEQEDTEPPNDQVPIAHEEHEDVEGDKS